MIVVHTSWLGPTDLVLKYAFGFLLICYQFAQRTNGTPSTSTTLRGKRHDSKERSVTKWISFVDYSFVNRFSRSTQYSKLNQTARYFLCLDLLWKLLLSTAIWRFDGVGGHKISSFVQDGMSMLNNVHSKYISWIILAPYLKGFAFNNLHQWQNDCL